jgi:hypothetical protein
VAKDPIGAMAQRRITDAAESHNPRLMLKKRAATYSPGDTDLSWTRLTHWRGLLAAALDQPPYEPITGAVVSGAPDSPSSELLAGWLSRRLRVPVRRVSTPRGSGIASVRLERESGPIDLVRPGDVIATLSQSGQPDRRINLPRREIPECLADELRRLDPDEAYAEALCKGVAELRPVRLSAADAAKAGKAPDIAAARRLASRLGRDESAQDASAMISAPPAPEHAETSEVKEATARKLAGKRTPREKQAAKDRKKAAAARDAAAGDAGSTGTGSSGTSTSRPTARKTAKRSAAAASTAKKTASRSTAGTRKAAAKKTAGTTATGRKTAASRTSATKRASSARSSGSSSGSSSGEAASS